MSKTCVKCGYVRQASDTAPDYECPKCGVIYAKAEAVLATKALGVRQESQIEKPEKPQMPFKHVILSIIVLCVIGALGYVGYQAVKRHDESQKQKEQAKAISKKENEVEKAKLILRNYAQEVMTEMIKLQLKDPDSVQLKNVQVFTETMKHKSGAEGIIQYILCGDLNAKNSYGGYVGYRSFIVSFVQDGDPPSSKHIYVNIQETGEGDKFSVKVEKECQNRVLISEKS